MNDRADDSVASDPPHVPADAVPTRWHRRVLTLAFPIVLANLTREAGRHQLSDLLPLPFDARLL